MSELLFIVFCGWMGFLNLAAGRDFFGYVKQGTLRRGLFALGSALASLLVLPIELWQAGLLVVSSFLYRTFDWGEWFAAVHGRKEQWRSKGDVDWEEKLSDKIWPIDPKPGMETRLKATLDMVLRMAWAIPLPIIVGNPLHLLLFPLLGISYFVMGLIGEKKSIERAEFANGVIIAMMLWVG